MNSLRWLLPAVFLLCLIPIAHADLVWPEGNGVSVFQAQLTSGESFVAGDSNGNSLLIWGDESTGDRNIHGMLVNSYQLPLWPVNGLPLVNLPEFQNAIGVVHSEDGWIVAWLDHRDLGEPDWSPEHDLALFIQKFDYDGVPQWNDEEQPPENGVLVFDGNFPSIEYDIVLLSDDNGGAYVVYILEDIEQGFEEPMAKHVLNDGSFGWASWGVSLLGPEETPPDHIENLRAVRNSDDDGFTAAWLSFLYTIDPEIRAQRVAADGTLWEYDSTPVIGALGNNFINSLTMCSDGAGGTYTSWCSDEEIHVQRVAEDGTLPWGDLAGQLFPTEEAWAIGPVIVPSSDNTAILFWQQDEFALPYAQRFGGETELETFWGEDGINISPVAYARPEVAQPDGSGGAVVYLKEAYGQVALLHLDVDGSVLFDEPLNADGSYLTDYSMVQSGDDRIALGSFLSDGQTTIRYQSYDLLAQQLYYPSGGISLTTGVATSIRDAHFALQNGTPYFAWYDGRSRPYGDQPILQALHPHTGQKLFGQYGLPLLPGFPFGGDEPIDLEVNDLDIAATGDDALVISCAGQYCNPLLTAGLYLQKATVNGELLWGDRGVFLDADGTNSFYNDHVFGTEDGGAIVVFNYLNEDFWARLGIQRFTANGEPQWSSGDFNFLAFSSGIEYADDAIVDVNLFSDGSLLILVRRNFPDDYFVYHISHNGEVMWDEPVQVASEFYYKPNMTPFGENMLIAMTYRVWPDPNMEIVGQLITPDGDLLWGEEPQVLIHDAGAVGDRQAHINITDEQSFWLAYVTVADPNYRIYAQRFNSSGQPLLIPELGVMVHESAFFLDASDDMIQTLPDNSLYLTWRTGYSTPLQVVYSRLNPDGSFPVQYANGPLTIQTMHHVYGPILVSDGDGGAYAYWTSYTEAILPFSTERLFAQRLNDGFASVDKPSSATPDSWVLHNAYPNPFNATTRISLDLPQRTDMRVMLFDILGREVMTIADERLAPGRHNFTVDASTLASGMYFLSVEQIGGTKKLQKLVVLK